MSLCHCVAVSLYHCVTVSFCHCVTAPLCPCVETGLSSCRGGHSGAHRGHALPVPAGSCWAPLPGCPWPWYTRGAPSDPAAALLQPGWHPFPCQ